MKKTSAAKRPTQNSGRRKMTVPLKASPHVRKASTPKATRKASSGTRAGAATTAAKASAAKGRRIFSEGRNVAVAGLDQSVKFGESMAAEGFGAMDRLAGASTEIGDMYRGATGEAADKMRALTAGYSHFGYDMVHMQRMWMNVMQRAFAVAGRGYQDLLKCRSPLQAAEAQRNICVDGVNWAVQSTSMLIRAARDTARGAATPV